MRGQSSPTRLKEVAPSYAALTLVTPISASPDALMTTADKVARALGKFFTRKLMKRICIELLSDLFNSTSKMYFGNNLFFSLLVKQ